MAKSLSIALASIALNAMLAVVVCAQTVPITTVEYADPNSSAAVRIGAFGPLQGCSTPSQLLFGTLPNGLATTEVVVEQHILRPGQQVPLPHYADGTEASESEVFWTAHVWEARFPAWQSQRWIFPAFYSGSGDRTSISFGGRTYGGGYSVINPHIFPLLETQDIDVAVTVIAARHPLATNGQTSTWGSVKVGQR